MGIIVSWINDTLWPNVETQLNDDSDSSSTSEQDASASTPTPTQEQHPIDSVSLVSPIPLRASSPPSNAITTPAIASIDSTMSSYFDDRPPYPSSSTDYSSEPSTPRLAQPPLLPTSSSPPPPESPGLQVYLPPGNTDSGPDREIDTVMHDVDVAAVPYSEANPNAYVEDAGDSDLCFDDEALSALERIYLFSRSSASFHRVFIARSLPQFLPDVVPSEAVEYVIPLMNGLAMDEDEAVREALVEDLVSSIWWFLTHCQVVDQDAYMLESETPLLDVQTFTPLLGTLLLNPSTNVGAPARMCVVTLLTRIRDVETKGEDAGRFGPKERKMFERELIHHIVIGMGHLDVPSESSESGSGEQGVPEVHQSHSRESLLEAEGDQFGATPAALARDEIMMATLESPSLATSQIVEQEERETPDLVALAAAIARPPSPLPSSPRIQPLALPDTAPEDVQQPEPRLAHLVAEVMPNSTTEAGPSMSSTNLGKNGGPNGVMTNGVEPLLASEPRPAAVAISSGISFNGDGGGEAVTDFSEEQAAIGRLASMSLMAAVTASDEYTNDSWPIEVPVDQHSQHAFVVEIERARYDPVYWVRREATFALGALAKVIPEELVFLSLLPLFEAFTDDSAWNVRQSVLFSLPAVLSRLPVQAKRRLAVETINKLNKDQTPQVRTAVLEVLGEVIYSFHEDEGGPPDEVVRLFIGDEGKDWHRPDSPALEAYERIQSSNPWANALLRSRSLNTSSDPFGRNSGASSPALVLPNSNPARPLVCAFNLPAVALTLGRERWPELRGLYLFLARTGAMKVRQTLAASIGEVARIIGPDNAHRDLVYRWWDFARSRDSVVRQKALEALELFLRCIDSSDRSRIAGSLEDIWDTNLQGWREREVLTKSLVDLSSLLAECGDVLRALLGRAFRDSTAAVRKAAIDAYPQIYRIVFDYPTVLGSVTDEVTSLAYDQSFRKRLTYVECKKSVLLNNPDLDDITEESFWEPVVPLVSDKIVDVRIVVARLIRTACDHLIRSQRPLPSVLQELVRRVAQDASKDVQAFVSHLLGTGTGPPTEQEPGSVSAVFSRPPGRKTKMRLVDGLKELRISERRVSPALPAHVEAG